MKTESTIQTRTVDRTASLTLVRVLDLSELEAIAKDGAIPLEALQTAGRFEILIAPNGRGAKTIRHTVSGELEGVAWLDGFEACNELKKKGPRAPKNGAGVKDAKSPPAKSPPAKGARK